MCSGSWFTVMVTSHIFFVKRQRHLCVLICNNATVVQKVLNDLAIWNMYKCKWQCSTTLTRMRSRSWLTAVATMSRFWHKFLLFLCISNYLWLCRIKPNFSEYIWLYLGGAELDSSTIATATMPRTHGFTDARVCPMHGTPTAQWEAPG
jgi:hypothetical protein